jgi:hypothetical protein
LDVSLNLPSSPAHKKVEFFFLLVLVFCFTLHLVLFCLSVWHRILLYTPGWPQSHYPPASASQVLGFWVCTTMLSMKYLYFRGSFLPSPGCGRCVSLAPGHLTRSSIAAQSSMMAARHMCLLSTWKVNCPKWMFCI